MDDIYHKFRKSPVNQVGISMEKSRNPLINDG